MSEPISELAAEIVARDSAPAAAMRTAVVTEVEFTGSFRVRTSISGTAWLSRLQDVFVAVGDRVSVLQQGSVMLVIGRLSPPNAGAMPIGSLLSYAGATAPAGWFICNGAAVSRFFYQTLFSICGTTYGAGDGTTTFNIPNLTNRVPVGAGGTYSRGGSGGAATVTLGIGEIPSHNHQVWTSGTFIDNTTQAGGGASDILIVQNSTTGNTGSGGAHENMPPYLALNYIIRAQ